MKLIVASTGGSGSGYLLRLFYHLLSVPGETHWMASDNFFEVMRTEGDLDLDPVMEGEKIAAEVNKLYPGGSLGTDQVKHKFVRYDYRDIGAPPSSGSVAYDAMVVLPCSMKTLAAIAGGNSSNLIERAADVSLKEKRKLILVPRESPYSLIHIENMRTLTLAGAMIMPASPGFYHRPRTIEDLYDFMIDRIFMQIGVSKRVIKPWGN